MLKKLIYLLIIALIFIVVAGEKNLNSVKLSEEVAFLPTIEKVQAEPIGFSEKLAAGNPVTIVFLGDYVTSADSLPDGHPNHVSLLTEWLDEKYPEQITVINAGMNANTVSHMKERIASDVLTHAPDLVIISAGLNDALGDWKIPVEEYAKNYRLIVEEIIANGETEVLIRTPNPTTSFKDNLKMLPYMRASSKLASQDQVYLFDFYQVMSNDVHTKKIAQTDLIQNKLYPNTKGQAYLFGEFKNYLTTAFINQ
ncbi:SGNH/GDSL hydrolase family protein [Planococcus kocurii]|uniref:GDSL family lipase n=1 Tax=Planococcus faecalis TaxID=1598147 RepID=A0ABN4XN36_9BACL|nr:GDSL-type esterase/lipase family protein [Planococcus faecalis]AQU80181.1 GDSL family lipase [Planococcus faecalis]OHX54261.1 GDSL family lipase [Planococcus faecalis]